MIEEKETIQESTLKDNAKLYKALSKAQGEIENAKFNKVNPHFKSRYSDLGSLRDAYQEHLSKFGLCLTQVFESASTGMVLITRLAHESGEFIDSRFPIVFGSNETMQAIGSKITYARRFSAGSITGIAAEEDDDANSISSPKSKEIRPKEKIQMAEVIEPETVQAPADPMLSNDQARIIEKLIGEDGDLFNRILDGYKVQDLLEIPAKNFDLICGTLKKRKEAKPQ